MQINGNQYQPVNTSLIPVGFATVHGTAFDFTHLKPIGQDIRNPTPDNGGQTLPDGTPLPQLVIAHGYDHNWVLNGSGNKLAAVAKDPRDGISLLTFTTEPGVQVYTARHAEPHRPARMAVGGAERGLHVHLGDDVRVPVIGTRPLRA